VICLLLAFIAVCGFLTPAQAAPQAVSLAVDSSRQTWLLWNNPDGSTALTKINPDTTVAAVQSYAPIVGWRCTAVAAGPSTPRLLWQHAADGQASVWTLDAAGAFASSTPGYGPYSGWTAQGLSLNGDSQARLLFKHGPSDQFAVWTLAGSSYASSTPGYGPLSSDGLLWDAKAIAGGSDSLTRLLLVRGDGAAAVWTLNGSGYVGSSSAFAQPAGYSCRGVAVGGDTLTRLLWVNTSGGGAAVWTLTSGGVFGSSTPLLGPPAGYTAVGTAVGSDNLVRLLWSDGAGDAQVWIIAAGGTYTVKTYSAGHGTPAADRPAPGWAQDVVPTDSGSDGGPDGPGSSMSVSLPSGVEENNPGPDLASYNSVGPSAVYERMYRSALAVQGYASPGLSPGWVDNFDLRVTSGSGTYTLHYPNGSTETWTGTTGSLTTPSGVPYLASSPTAGTLLMKFRDRSVYTFTQQSAASASGQYPAGTYLLTGMQNLVGRSVTLSRDTAANNYRVLSVTNDAATPLTLFQMSYSGGSLASVQDLGSPNAAERRQVSYTFTGGLLSNVSQVAAPGVSAPDHWRYAYQAITGGSLLNGVSAPSPADPTGQTYSSAAVTYDPAGYVTAHMDANNHLRSYSNIAGGVALQFFNKPADTTPILQQTQTFAAGSNVDSGFTDAGSYHASIAYSGTPSPYLPSAVTNRNQQMSSITYDTANAYGNVASVMDPRGVQVNNVYQYPTDFALGQLSSTQTVSGTSSLSPTTLAYYGTADGVINGLLKTMTTPLPDTVGSTSTVTTTYSYDALGNVVSVTTPGPNSTVGTASTYTTVTYNYTTAYGGATVAEALGEPQSVTVSGPANGGGTTTTVTYFKYDGRGNQTAVIDCLGNETDTVYNLADQMTGTLYPATNQTGSGRSQTGIAYEYVGGPANTLSVYDEGNTSGPVRQTTYAYGPEGELLQTSDLKGPVTAYQYDALYRTTAVQDGQNLQNALGKMTLYSYDTLGNLAQMLYPLYSGPGPGAFDTTTYAYDHDSNLMTRTDGNNAVTTYVRDQAVDSRLTGVNYPSGSNTPNVTLGYDVFERLSSLSNSVVAKTYSYDDIDEMLGATVSFTGGPQSQAMTYGYAPDGSRTSLATPLGSYSYQYDGLGQLTRADFPWTGGSVNHTYIKNATTGAVRTGWLGTSMTPRGLTSYNYNVLGQIIGLSNQWANYPNSPGSKTTGSLYSPLTHDALGNKTGEPANIPAAGHAPNISHTLSYGYDTRDELTGEQSAQASGGTGGASLYSNSFGYDLSFNPTSFKGSTLTQNADNQFLSGDFGTNWLFDGNGSPTTYQSSSLTFDIENRLTSIASPAFSAAYAPDDRRASKTVSGATTYYLYDEAGGASPLLEEQGSSVSMGYGMAGDGLRARYAPASGGLYYLFQWDPQGSLVQRQTGGPGGNTSYYALDTAMYDGYGAKLGDTDAFTGGAEATRDAMGFQGQFGAYTDNETGLVLMGHRYYDAGTGRFLTRDPLGYGGGINLYGFTGNNPVNESDPSGFAPDLPEGKEGKLTLNSEDVQDVEDAINEALEIREEQKKGSLGRALELEALLRGRNKPIIRFFPQWRPSGPLTQLTPEGGFPEFFASSMFAKSNTIQGRYWINRASSSTPEEFTKNQLGSMELGFAPTARIIVRVNKTGAIEVRTVSKELHHSGGRAIPNAHQPYYLYEVWPWQHDAIDKDHHTGYTFLQFAK